VTAKPIIALRHSVKTMGDGDLTSKTKVQGSDEIKELAENFNRLGDQLTEYIDKLQDETAKRQSVESELAIASEIQQSILPRVFPPFPGRDEFDLYSIMHPAKEVGGDFYDFFFYDHDTFVFLVGDVSGKGVPAALFMMLCRTLLHSTASESKDPAAVLKKVNNVLAQENDTNMFVTVFLAYYFVDSGKIVYSNAGHLPALKVKENNEIEELSSDNSVAMGIFSDVEFSTSESTLAINDKFVLYTDGITEAVSAEEEFYGMERFIEYFKTNKHLSSKQDCANILEQIMSFQQDNQYDDITLSVFKRLT
jgi:sigma-B regulation protein RsbU (phosphoserine phosphatase)